MLVQTVTSPHLLKQATNEEKKKIPKSPKRIISKPQVPKMQDFLVDNKEVVLSNENPL